MNRRDALKWLPAVFGAPWLLRDRNPKPEPEPIPEPETPITVQDFLRDNRDGTVTFTTTSPWAVHQGHWVLLDYGDVVIHIFYEPVREFYDLEGFWIEASRIELDGANIQKT